MIGDPLTSRRQEEYWERGSARGLGTKCWSRCGSSTRRSSAPMTYLVQPLLLLACWMALKLLLDDVVRSRMIAVVSVQFVIVIVVL